MICKRHQSHALVITLDLLDSTASECGRGKVARSVFQCFEQLLMKHTALPIELHNLGNSICLLWDESHLAPSEHDPADRLNWHCLISPPSLFSPPTSLYFFPPFFSCVSFNTFFTIFCSSIKNARTILSRTQLPHLDPPYALRTVFCACDVVAYSRGLRAGIYCNVVSMLITLRSHRSCHSRADLLKAWA